MIGAQEALNLIIYLTALTVINLLWGKRELGIEVIAIYLVFAGFSFYNYRKLKELEKTEPKHSRV